MFNYFYNVRKYFKFDKEEVKGMFMVIMLFTFVLGYDDGFEKFEMTRWIFNLLTSFVIASSAVLAKETGHKLMAIKRGFTTKMKVWWPMFLIQILLVIIFKGRFHIVIPVTGLFIFHHERMRLGEFRYGHNYFDNTLIALSGLLFNVFLAMLFKFFSFLPNPTIIIAMEFNIAYAIINMLPLDIIYVLLFGKKWLEHADIRKHPAPFAGTYLFYSSIMFYLISVFFVLILSASMMMLSIVWSISISLILTFIFMFFIGLYTDYDIV